MHAMESQKISTDTLLEKYCKYEETTEDEIFRRVSKKIASAEKTPELQNEWAEKFYEMMKMGGIGGGRIMATAGTDINATIMNCFTQSVGDSIVEVDDEGYPGIYTALAEAAETLRRGGGVGYDFSRIRPMDAFVKGTNSFASGPCSYMDVFDQSCKTVESAGCFAGETLIDTTEGLVTIKEIVKSDKDWYVNTHLGTRKVITKFKSGIKESWLVKTLLGKEIITTIEHKYAVFNNTNIITIPLFELKENNFNQSIISIIDNTSFSLVEDKIIYCESIGEIETYDLEVDEVHLLSGNGIYTSNSRRGAQLGALRADHPDIEKFIVAKRTPNRWNNFNVSVFVSDAFMDAVKNNTEWELVHKATPTDRIIKENNSYKRPDGKWVYKKVKALDLWNQIMQSNYDFAEPGILFEDNININNNLRYTEYINTTNPCGEIPLPDYGCCDLGAIILPKLVLNPFKPNVELDIDKLKLLISHLVRFLDNALDVNFWPLKQQAKEASDKRRIGLGFTGLGNMLAMMNLKYNSLDGRMAASNLTEIIRNTAYTASIELAKEKGAFPLFDAKKYTEAKTDSKPGTFASNLPNTIVKDIKKYGIRNSHLLTVAPTGTISLSFADNASNGIEPPFSYAYSRKKRTDRGGEVFYTVIDHSVRVFLEKVETNKDKAKAALDAMCAGKKVFEFDGKTITIKEYLPESIVTALEISADDHLLMMSVIQPNIDNSISKTVNVAEDYLFDDFKNIYFKAHEYGLKGIATYRPNSILGSVLSEIKEAKVEETIIESTPTKSYYQKYDDEYDSFINAVIPQLPNEEYPAIRKKVSYSGPEGKDSFFILISLDTKDFEKNGIRYTLERPVEVFIETNPENVPSEWVDSLSRNLSLLARSGLSMFCKALENCKKAKSDKGRVRYGWINKADGTQVPRFHSSEIACIGFAITELLQKRNIITDSYKPYEFNKLIDKIDSNGAVEITSNSEEDADKIIPTLIYGKLCTNCGANAVIKKDGCNFCTNCGEIGSCG